MLVCPHCQFENPDDHKFCEQCGASLIEKNCPACGATVAFALEHCPQCGTTAGTVWRAIVLPSPDTASSPESTAIPAFGKYLDRQERYCLLESIAEPIATELETRVLDCQPLQFADLESRPQLTADRSHLPTMAQPYLILQENHPSLPLPHLHDAWTQDGLDIILLEDRAELPSLLDLWCDDDVLPLQTLHWLHEMLEFWAVLQPQHCCQSLLELDNLYVDEDYLLCLQRLHTDPPDHSPQLRDLGVVWQTLFQQSQRTQNSDLARLCFDLEHGSVSSLEQLRSRIEAIAILLQPHPERFCMTSPFPEPLDTSAADPGEAAHLEVLPSIPASLLADLDAEPDDETEISEEASIDDAPTIVLPMCLVNLEDAGRTDIGRQRDHNEDCFSIQTDVKKLESPQGRLMHAKGLYILCDGMGGHASGEVASALAVQTLQNYFAAHWHDQLPDEAIIQKAIQDANGAIYDLNQQSARSGSGRMGTTLVLVLIQGTEAVVAHVGDSRLYRFSRRRGLEQITVDHEVGQREIQRGVEPAIAYARPDAYQLTQALGPRDEHFINPDIKFLELNEDLLLLLCSDGLTDNNLLETYCNTHLEPILSPQVPLDQGVSELIDLANQVNGHDNITAIGIRARVRPNLEHLNRQQQS